MTILRLWLAAVVLVLVHAAVMTLMQPRGVRGAGIDFVPAEVAVFDLKEGEKHSLTLQVRNQGSTRAALRIWGSCACTVPQMEHVELGPGESCPVPVTIDTLVSPGGNTAWVYAEDTNKVRLAASRVSFKSQKDYLWTPAVVSVERGNEQAVSTRLCSLEHFGNAACWDGCTATTESTGLQCELVSGSGRCAELKLRATRACDVGAHTVFIRSGVAVRAVLHVGVRAEPKLVTVGVPRRVSATAAELVIEGRDGWVPVAVTDPAPCPWATKSAPDLVTRLVLEVDRGTRPSADLQVSRGGFTRIVTITWEPY